MIIIACGGLAQAGKTTFCEAVDDDISHTRTNYTVERLSFANPIREAAAAVGITKADHRDLYRKFAQWVGTDCLRESDPNWWVNLMNAKLRQLAGEEIAIQELGGPKLELVVLIDDVRFLNEVALIHKWGGKMVFVDAARRTPPPTEEWQQHESEQLALDYMNIDSDLPDETFDLSITNNGTKEAYQIDIRNTYPGLI